MKFKGKKLAFLFVAVSMFAVSVSCSDKTEKTTENTEISETENITENESEIEAEPVIMEAKKGDFGKTPPRE
ncbi:MAG: hypothetical protein K2J08_00720, partial [Ruminococcus sp.]|nr:hypothetical protein [Ruminococcus sp.]